MGGRLTAKERPPPIVVHEIFVNQALILPLLKKYYCKSFCKVKDFFVEWTTAPCWSLVSIQVVDMVFLRPGLSVTCVPSPWNKLHTSSVDVSLYPQVTTATSHQARPLRLEEKQPLPGKGLGHSPVQTGCEPGSRPSLLNWGLQFVSRGATW